MIRKKKRLILLIVFAALVASISASIITYGKDAEEFVRPDLIPYIEEVSSEYGVSPELIEAMIETESGGDIICQVRNMYRTYAGLNEVA